MRLEFHRWPSPIATTRNLPRSGVLAMDLETGVAVHVCSEQTAERNQRLAEERLRLLLDPATTAATWTEPAINTTGRSR